MSARVADRQLSHVARFYRHDGDLPGLVADHVATGLRDGAVAVLAATPPHLLAIEAELVATGIDVAALRDRDRFVELDAEALADAMTRSGSFDAGVFDADVRPVIERAVATRRDVLVYGEIVGVLWGRGEVDAVIELERCWDELAAAGTFSLLCGVPVGSVTRSGSGPALSQVPHLHDEVRGLPRTDDDRPWFEDTARATFDPDVTAPRRARAFARALLDRWDVDDDDDAVSHVMTELAANAVVHARSGVDVLIASRPGTIRLEVDDRHAGTPAVAPASSAATSGRGLLIVQALATRWGVDPDPVGDGKTVWAELGTGSLPLS